MKQESILYGIIGLLAGITIASFSASYAVNNNHNSMMRIMGINTATNSRTMMDNDEMTIGKMSDALANKTGDDFDKAFLAEMIIHHQGAIDMAKLAQTNAKHDEVKNLAGDILTVQSKEIDMIQIWQSQWDYKTTPSIESHDMMDIGH